MNNKGYLDLSFSFIFALIIGGAILFGAIYGVVKISNVAETKDSLTSSNELGNIFDSLQTGGESASSSIITFSTNTRIINTCDSFEKLGNQGIEVSKYIKNTWTKTGLKVEWQNKYIFSKNIIEGKKFYAFTKPFNFPYKTADLIYLVSSEDKYCFLNPSLEIRSEISQINLENFYLQNCPENSIKVCFENKLECDIFVDEKNQEVIKNEETLKYDEKELMYAAIFSDKKTYECTVSRLIERSNLLSKVYFEEINFVESRCPVNLYSELLRFSNSLEEYKNLDDLTNIIKLKNELEQKNKYSRCRLW